MYRHIQDLVVRQKAEILGTIQAVFILTAQLIGFLVLVRTQGPEALGLLSYLLAFANLVRMVDVGGSVSSSRFISMARHTNGDESNILERYLSTILTTNIFVNGILCICLLLFGYGFGHMVVPKVFRGYLMA
jgi:O-antigen/teichoic acid export membrane protein